MKFVMPMIFMLGLGIQAFAQIDTCVYTVSIEQVCAGPSTLIVSSPGNSIQIDYMERDTYRTTRDEWVNLFINGQGCQTLTSLEIDVYEDPKAELFTKSGKMTEYVRIGEEIYLYASVELRVYDFFWTGLPESVWTNGATEEIYFLRFTADKNRDILFHVETGQGCTSETKYKLRIICE